MKLKCSYSALHGEHRQVQLTSLETPTSSVTLHIDPATTFFEPGKWYEMSMRFLGDEADILPLPPIPSATVRPSNVVDIRSAALEAARAGADGEAPASP